MEHYPPLSTEEKQQDGHSTATAGIMGGGLAGGLLAPTLFGVAQGGSQAATTTTSTGAPTDPLGIISGPVKAIGGSALKVGKDLYDAGSNAKAAHKDWGGKEKIYAWDDLTDTVEQKVRGEDTETANGFKHEIAKDKARKAVHSGIKAVTDAGKGTSKSMGSMGALIEMSGINPVGSASQIAAGTHKMVKSGIEVTEHQIGKHHAREGEHAAQERGDMLEHGLHQAKVSHSEARNEAGRQGVLGALEATTGSLGIAQFADPTGGTAVAHKVLAGTTKAGKKGNMVYNSVKHGRKWEKVQRMRAAAEAGDPDAMKWLMRKDPRTASAQMLLHTQRGSKDSKEFAQEHVANSLGLGDKGKEELATGKLSEFDKLYAGRTGQNIESQLKHKEAAAYKVLGPVANKIDKVLGRDKKKKKSDFGVEKKRDAGVLSGQDNYLAEEAAKITAALDQEKKLKAMGASEDEQVKAFADVDRGAKPLRAIDEVREFRKVKDFREEKTHAELIESMEQKALKGRYKANDPGIMDKIKGKEATGELWNPDQYATAEEMVDESHKKTAYKGLGGKADKKAAKIASKVPFAENKAMPADIRAGVIRKEEERRQGQRHVGHDLPFQQPLDADWKERQALATELRKERRKARKEAGQLPGQIHKRERRDHKKMTAVGKTAGNQVAEPLTAPSGGGAEMVLHQAGKTAAHAQPLEAPTVVGAQWDLGLPEVPQHDPLMHLLPAVPQHDVLASMLPDVPKHDVLASMLPDVPKHDVLASMLPDVPRAGGHAVHEAAHDDDSMDDDMFELMLPDVPWSALQRPGHQAARPSRIAEKVRK